MAVVSSMRPEKLNIKGTSYVASRKPTSAGSPYIGSAPRVKSTFTRPPFMLDTRSRHSLKLDPAVRVERPRGG